MVVDTWLNIKSLIEQIFPFWNQTVQAYPIPHQLLFNRPIPLSQQICSACDRIIKAFWQLRQNPSYQKYVKKQSGINHDPQNYAILMCYDFHVTEDGVKLIEINTNASFALIADLLNHQFHTSLPPKKQLSISYHEMLKNSIHEEWNRFGLNTNHKTVAIIDDQPEKQKAYFEFQYYKTLFEHWGWKTFICDPSDLYWNASQQQLEYDGQMIPFIYNRHCDFLFEDPKNQHLKQAFLDQVCFSPNPYEYSLLAHKQRLIDLSKKGFIEQFLSKENACVLQKVIPYSFSILDQTKEDLWSQRRKLFFKPKKLYGSKGAFRGMSISKSKLESIYNKEFMVQEYIPPPVFEGYKYDLRIYAYMSEMHLAVAKLYQGQVSNAQTPGGGLAPIQWTKT